MKLMMKMKIKIKTSPNIKIIKNTINSQKTLRSKTNEKKTISVSNNYYL